MISRITDLPPYVTAFEVSGEVTKADYDNVIIPAVDKIAKENGELYFLFVLKTELKNLSAGFWWDDLKVSLQHLRHWRKVAVVSDSKTIEKLTGLFAYVSPAKSKGFMMDQLEEAKTWVSEKVH